MRWLAAVLVVVAGAALAHDGATGVVKQRMDGMKDMSNATKALGAIKAGAIPYSPEVIRRAAGQFINKGRAQFDLYPEGSDGGMSDALDTVWSDRVRFEALLTDLIRAGERLDAVAAEEAAALSAADDVAKTCKACHADFRRKTL
ncbi:MAG: cytochrome c [Pseudomonadota bacterium]